MTAPVTGVACFSPLLPAKPRETSAQATRDGVAAPKAGVTSQRLGLGFEPLGQIAPRLVKTGQVWANVGRIWAETSQTTTNFGRVSTTLGQHSTNVAKPGPYWTPHTPKAAETRASPLWGCGRRGSGMFAAYGRHMRVGTCFLSSTTGILDGTRARTRCRELRTAEGAIVHTTTASRAPPVESIPLGRGRRKRWATGRAEEARAEAGREVRKGAMAPESDRCARVHGRRAVGDKRCRPTLSVDPRGEAARQVRCMTSDHCDAPMGRWRHHASWTDSCRSHGR